MQRPERDSQAELTLQQSVADAGHGRQPLQLLAALPALDGQDHVLEMDVDLHRVRTRAARLARAGHAGRPV